MFTLRVHSSQVTLSFPCTAIPEPLARLARSTLPRTLWTDDLARLHWVWRHDEMPVALVAHAAQTVLDASGCSYSVELDAEPLTGGLEVADCAPNEAWMRSVGFAPLQRAA